mmetsp:Transcript_26985/g.39874  ORF Transcript_26985/g.39874 Transcript_26985/m.39874 type:complete len:216 (-) Transcript_26985:145-792(-)
MALLMACLIGPPLLVLRNRTSSKAWIHRVVIIGSSSCARSCARSTLMVGAAQDTPPPSLLLLLLRALFALLEEDELEVLLLLMEEEFAASPPGAAILAAAASLSSGRVLHHHSSLRTSLSNNLSKAKCASAKYTGIISSSYCCVYVNAATKSHNGTGVNDNVRLNVLRKSQILNRSGKASCGMLGNSEWCRSGLTSAAVFLTTAVVVGMEALPFS